VSVSVLVPVSVSMSVSVSVSMSVPVSVRMTNTDTQVMEIVRMHINISLYECVQKSIFWSEGMMTTHTSTQVGVCIKM